MILLDIINNVSDIFENNSSCNSSNKQYITLKFKNNKDSSDTNVIELNNTDNILDKKLDIGESVEIKCKLCGFLGSGSYGRVYKIKINKKYYALKVSENEDPNKFIKRYNSIVEIDKIKKYIVNIFVVGNIKCDKYPYYSIMEFGGQNLKSKIPLNSFSELISILRQLHNIVYLCGKYKIIMTDFKLNNIVINNDNRLKLIDIYMECKSYSPCRECRIVKTYSTLEIDKVKNILDNEEYNHTYHLIPLGVGLIDLLCKNSASYIFTKLGSKYGLSLNIKQMIPLCQIACYNYSHKSNSSIRDYDEVYNQKKKLEKKYYFLKEPDFYENFMKLIEVRDNFKDKIPTKKLHIIIHHLFSANPDDRSLDPLKQQLNDI
jgi:hypothetical protein